MSFCEYLVTGRRNYRGHTPGTLFEAQHDAAKQRAIGRGDIKVIRLIAPGVPKGATLPDRWPPTVTQTHEGG